MRVILKFMQLLKMYKKKKIGVGTDSSRFDFGLNWNFFFSLGWELKKKQQIFKKKK